MKNKRFSSTHTRIAIAFTLLFLSAVILLTIFLKTSIDAIDYNSQARATYAETRQLYQAKIYLQQFERALNYYEITSDPDFLDEYNSSFARLQQYLVNASLYTSTEAEEAGLEQLIQDTQALRGKFDLVIAAVDEEDWENVVALDSDAYQLVGQIFTRMDELIAVRTQNLEDLRAEVDGFNSTAWNAILLATPLFLLLMGFVSLTIVRQVNAPLILMTSELKSIIAARFTPAILGKLPERNDEIGYLAREYIQTASAVKNRQTVLQQEMDEIRSRIR